VLGVIFCKLYLCRAFAILKKQELGLKEENVKITGLIGILTKMEE
jgi:hypothetical protein